MIQKLLARDPFDRYKSAFQLLQDLKNLDLFDTELAKRETIRLGTVSSPVSAFELPFSGREAEFGELLRGWQDGFALGELSICMDEMLSQTWVSKNHLKLLERGTRDLKRCRHMIPYQYSLVCEGALAWFKGNPNKAIALLDKAETTARLDGNHQARFEALRCRALILRLQSNPEAFEQDVRIARALAEEYDWAGRLKKFNTQFPEESSGSSRYLSHHTGGHRASAASGDFSGHSGSMRPAESFQSQKMKRRFDALLQLNRASSQSGILEDQTRIALDEVVRIMNAERGFLFVNGDRGLIVQTARDAYKKDVHLQSEYSRSVVEKVRISKAAFIFTGQKDQEVDISKSMQVLKLRSAMAAPLMKDDNLIGILYVDSTVARGLFQQDDLEMLAAISGHIAVNFEAARARQLELEKGLLQKDQELTAAKIKTAHAAGMAEIATGSIHNIGNTLTTVVANFDLVRDHIANSKIPTFVEAAQVLAQNKDNLVEFMTHGSKGIHIMNLFIKLGDLLGVERKELSLRLDAIEKGINNVKEVLVMQQDYARAGLHKEEISISGFLDEVLQFESASFARHHIRIEKNYSSVKKVIVQKNKLLNVMINLFKNAKEAMLDNAEDQRVIKLAVTEEGDFVKVAVTDSGHGIASENISRVFAQSFTTKRTGGGFGLHISANAMTEMGGAITAFSEGPKMGATFVVSLPIAAISKTEDTEQKAP